MTGQDLAPPLRTQGGTLSRLWPIFHALTSAVSLFLVAVAALVAWSEVETIVVLGLPLTLTTAATLATSAWLLAGRGSFATVVLGRLALGGTLAVFVLGAFVALATWSKGFDYVDTAQEVPPRLEQIGDLGYRTALIGFMALILASAAVGLAVTCRRGPRT